MDLRNRSNAELENRLSTLTGNERATIVEILFHLIEVERRGLFRGLGFSSLYDYCTRGLKYAESSAYRRVKASRCLRDHPELESLLLEGKVTLHSVATAAQSIEEGVASINDIVGVNTRAVERLVARSAPVPVKPREVAKPVVIKAEPLPLFAAVQPEAEERVEIRFSVSRADYQTLEELKLRFSNAMGKEVSFEALFLKLAESHQAPKTRRVRVRSGNSRYVPRSIKLALYERDKGQCCFVSETGIRCCERKHLQIDHVVPFAKGGATELSNLRLLCPAHNRLMAERHFGKAFIESCSR